MNCPYCGAPELAEPVQSENGNSGWVNANIIRVNSWDQANSLQELYRCMKCNHRWNVPVQVSDEND